jgi:integrase
VLARIPDGRSRDLVILLALTGARIGEIAALTVGDVDLRAGVLTLSGADDRRHRRGKSRPREWPIGGDLARMLARLMGDRAATEPLVPGLPLDCSELVRQALMTACVALDVPRFTSHGIRRMVVMELLDVTDAKSVSELTGHSVATLLRFYVRPRSSSLRDVVRRSGVGTLAARPQLMEVGAQNPGTQGKDDDGHE